LVRQIERDALLMVMAQQAQVATQPEQVDHGPGALTEERAWLRGQTFRPSILMFILTRVKVGNLA
jgi:hypothetical protein